MRMRGEDVKTEIDIKTYKQINKLYNLWQVLQISEMD